MVVEGNRRPIAQRNRAYAKALTRWLAKAGVTPNQISMSSIVFGALAGACFAASGLSENVIDRVLLFAGAALFCQLRLLANMLDGMVAVEAGKGAPDGPVWNEAPDRFSDIFVLVGAGYGAMFFGTAEATLGYAAAIAAVMTAYVREVARGAGAPNDFSGPMAKPHRMFVMTMAALIAISAALWPTLPFKPGQVIEFGLWIVVIGATFTTLNRLVRALIFLNKR